MKEIITVNNIEQKTTISQKTYWLVSTPSGNMSIWDEPVFKQLTIGKSFEVETLVSGKYKTIKIVYKESGQAASNTVPSPSDMIGKSAQAKRKAEMMICAKDIVLSCLFGQKFDNPDVEMAERTKQTKVIWRDLMRTIGEPIQDEE